MYTYVQILYSSTFAERFLLNIFFRILFLPIYNHNMKYLWLEIMKIILEIIMDKQKLTVCMLWFHKYICRYVQSL